MFPRTRSNRDFSRPPLPYSHDSKTLQKTFDASPTAFVLA